ncbi:hypothetical protein [Methylobacterium planeticum]|uniref:DUF4440 domain-containing protein n=1 Tax=Methylobacterium planeticum TaxID=2615211 RepID=A0A6N6MWE1_9HYPH|nr:hypothetical protein [Methylobacterium planeticum]KAB1075582.1 hypothetical protein F6X51_02560 [Methylobacterium planeticum]
MRLLVSVSAAALLSTLLAAGPAGAQTPPGWVDPPARGTAPGPAPRREPAAPPQATAPAAPQDSAEEAAESAAPARRRTAERARPPRASRQAERREERRQARSAHRAPRRLADAPAAAPVAPAPQALPPAASDGRVAEWARASQRFADDYLESVSAPGDGIVGAAPRLYAESVRFHGRTLSLRAIMAEKRSFARRWPDRRYEAQGGSTRTACNAALASCIVYTLYDFRARNPATGARSQGVAELQLELSFAGGRPLIISEKSRVLRREGAVSAAAAPPRGA